MEMTIKKQIGVKSYTFIAKGENIYEMIAESKRLSFPDIIEKCGLCTSTNLFLDSNLAKKKFKYAYIKCADCGGVCTFGNKQEDPNIYYLRRTTDNKLDWHKYTKDEENTDKLTNSEVNNMRNVR